jgi:hypothetical protein
MLPVGIQLVLALGLGPGADGPGAPPELNPGDARALLEASVRSEEAGQLGLAERGYRQVLKLDQGTTGAEASFRLARLEIRRQRFEAGHRRLREAAARGHAGARAELEKIESVATRRQRQIVAAAEEALQAGKLAEARKLYTQAYEMAPEKPTGVPFIARQELLPLIARVVDAIDDEYLRKKAQPLERSVQACGPCSSQGGSQGGGFKQCAHCEGKGFVLKRIVLRGGRVIERQVDCGDCARIGWVFCQRCLGLDYALDPERLSADEREAIARLVNKVRALPLLRKPLGQATAEVEDVLLRAEESAALAFLRAMTPRYTLAKEIQSTLGRPPPDAEGLEAAAGAWSNPRLGLRTRANFLLSYAADFADYLQPFEMLRGRLRKMDFAAPPNAALHLPMSPLAPEVLAAFPEEGAAGWTAVTGRLQGYSEAGDATKGILDVQGEAPHAIRFFVWRPEAKPHLQRLEKGAWAARVAGLARAYPFDIGSRAKAVPRGRRVTLAGRFLRDRLGFPRNWFEVWSFKVGLTPQQEAAEQLLEELVDVSFPAIEARKLSSFLNVWFGVPLALEGVDGAALLSIEAQRCPLGLLAGEVAAALETSWCFRDGKIVLAARPPRGAREDTETVLKEIVAPGAVVTVKRARAGASEPAADSVALPSGDAGLKDLLRQSSRAMRYATAARCARALAAAAAAGTERDKLERMAARLELYDELTRSVPRSSLVGAADIVRLSVQRQGSTLTRQTVRVLERGAGYLVIQPAHGGKARIERDIVKTEEPLEAVAWSAEKKAAMERQASALETAAGREKASGLFLLALSAKTNGFPEKGTGFLEKASKEDDFEWVLATYFPRRQEALRAKWVAGTGRDAPPQEPVAAPAPLPASGLRPDEPLPADPAQLLAFARRHHVEGAACLSRALPGMDEAATQRRRARDHFVAARDALDRLLASRPGEEAAQRMRRDVVLLLQNCVKEMGFFE